MSEEEGYEEAKEFIRKTNKGKKGKSGKQFAEGAQGIIKVNPEHADGDRLDIYPKKVIAVLFRDGERYARWSPVYFVAPKKSLKNPPYQYKGSASVLATYEGGDVRIKSYMSEFPGIAVEKVDRGRLKYNACEKYW